MGGNGHVKMMRRFLRTPASSAMFLAMFALWLTLAHGSRCYAQDQTKGAKVDEVAGPSSEGSAKTESKSGELPAEPATAPDPEISPAVARELAAMKAQIEQLKSELKSRPAAEPASSAPVTGPAAKGTESVSSTAPVDPAAQEARTGLPAKPAPTDPFAYADWTWLNGTARNKDVVWDSKFFTPEIRLDTHFVSSLNHPKDDTLGA